METVGRTLLHVTDGYNGHRYYVDGRRARKARYDLIFSRADRVDSMHTVRRKGAWYFYASASLSGFAAAA